MHHPQLALRIGAVLASITVLVAACGGGQGTPAGSGSPSGAPEASASAATQAPAGKTTVTAWTHSAGNPNEMTEINAWISAFNDSQQQWEVVVEAFPQGSYNDAVVAGALSKSLPCILDVDGPIVPNWAYAGYLKPLDVPQATLDAFLPSTTGKWDGKVYAQGQFEAAVAVFARKSDLDSLGIRVPTIDKPWTGQEFQAALDAYKGSGKFEYAFDPGMAWTGEWYPYGYSPFLQSFGGDLIDRSTYLTAEKFLNGPEAVAWGEWWQKLFADGYAPGTSQSAADRESGFVDGKVGLQWNGIWAAGGALEKFGDDLLFLPAPDFGKGPTIGAGSWEWSVSSTCPTPNAGDAFINFGLTPERVAAMADAQTNIPGRADARALTEKFKDRAPLSVFYDLSKAQALIRPPTPAYLTIAKLFEKAAADIANGSDVQKSLDTAADEIAADIERNGGYGF